MGLGPTILQATPFTLELGTAATGITVPLQESKRERMREQREGRRNQSQRERKEKWQREEGRNNAEVRVREK